MNALTLSAASDAGDRLSAWLAEADPVILQADRRQIAAIAAELSGKRVRGAGQ